MSKEDDPLFMVLLATLPDPIVLLNEDNLILYVNASAEDFLSTSLSQLLNHSWSEIFGKDYILSDVPRRVRLEKGTLTLRDLQLTHPKIGTHSLDVSACLVDLGKTQSPPFFHKALRKGEGVILSFHLHRLQGKLDGALQQRGGIRQVSALTSMLAHEVKNPLSGIRGAAQLLEQSLPKEEGNWARMILQETDRVMRLLQRLDAFGENPYLERKNINIHEVLNRVIEVASTGFAKDIEIIRRFDPSLPSVFGDFDQLVQVFLNLVKNGAEACPPKKGILKLTTQFVGGIRLQINQQHKATALPLMVMVEDNGQGIDPAVLPHLFEPFFTTKPDGTGIGLAIAAKIIGDHGGVINVDSHANGTSFKVLLPLA